MATFKEFLSENQSNALVSLNSHKELVVKRSTMALLTSVSVQDKISSKEAEKFANELAEMVHSEIFLGELSANLPAPKLAASKEEYVAKAKAEMKALLKKKLAK